LVALKGSAEIEHPFLAVEGDDRSLNAKTTTQDTGHIINSGGHLSLLQNCSRLFKFSPREMGEQSSEQATQNIPFGARLEEASQSDKSMNQLLSMTWPMILLMQRISLRTVEHKRMSSLREMT
jgi:hypothetical protein